MTDFSLHPDYFTAEQVADIFSVSKNTVQKWADNQKLTPDITHNKNKLYHRSQISKHPEGQKLLNSDWENELHTKPTRAYRSVELFAGAGGLAIGLEQAGFHPLFLNELDRHACDTLRFNRPNWKVIEGDVSNIDFTPWAHQEVDLLSGGFPCQAFSYAGKKMGFEDTRGTLFFEFARAVKALQPKVLLAENVRGLLRHDQGNTLATIESVIQDLGYTIVPPKVLKAVFYKVPQKRERLFIVGIRKDLCTEQALYQWPSPYPGIMTMRDALKKGELYECDVPKSPGQTYPARKKEILSMVPPGGYWRDLPDDIQREYMKKSYFLGGGKTGMARRLSWDEPSLTLTCAPAQKQTERCHPDETRPLTVREYARVQTFPDAWQFSGSTTAQYKQIGNAVPVNLAAAMGRSLIRLLNQLEKQTHEQKPHPPLV